MLRAGRTSVYKRSHPVSPLLDARARGKFGTYGNTDQDHLDVAEHLRDADDDVQQNGHELRETRWPDRR
jgi:hypothetical protein